MGNLNCHPDEQFLANSAYRGTNATWRSVPPNEEAFLWRGADTTTLLN
jgi:hypothetical protein